MAWSIEVVEGPDRGLRAAVSGGGLVVGRDSSLCGLVLTDSRLSRKHALFRLTGDGTLQVEDLGSTNGVYVNEKKITGACRVKPEDRVSMGETGITAFWADDAPVAAGKSSSARIEPDSAEKDLPLSFGPALVAPFSGTGFLSWLLGALLSAVPVVEFLAGGYRYRLIRNGASGTMGMPGWEKLGDLFIKGFQFFLIKLFYLFIPGALTVYLAYGFISRSLNFSTLAMLLTFAAVTLIITGFFLPMAWARFAAFENFGSAFQLQALARDIKAVASRYSTILLLLLGLWVIVISFSLIPVVGWALSAFGAFYIHIATSLLYGEAYRRSTACQA